MPVTLPPTKNPYSGRTPFDILGVTPSATAREMTEARDERLEDIDFGDHDDQERIQLKNEVNQAYDQIRNVRARVSLEIFFFDQAVGQEECRRSAEQHQAVTFDFDRVLKGVEAIMPTAPDVQGAGKQFRDVPLEQSVRLQSAGDEFAPDPTREALKTIAFER